MKVKRIDHAGVIVANLTQARLLLEQGFGLVAERDVELPGLIATF